MEGWGWGWGERFEKYNKGEKLYSDTEMGVSKISELE